MVAWIRPDYTGWCVFHAYTRGTTATSPWVHRQRGDRALRLARAQTVMVPTSDIIGQKPTENPPGGIMARPLR